MKFWKKFRIPMILLIVAVVVVVAVIAIPKQRVTYKEETVALRDLTTYNSFVGNIQPASERTVTAKVGETVTEVRVKEGDRVKAGDVLALLDTETLDYNIWRAEENLEISKKQYDFNVENASLSSPLPGYEDYLYDTGKISLDIAEKELERLKDTRKYYTITAPADGTITYLNIKEGETVAPSMALAVISDLDHLNISVRIDEYSILNAKEGLPVTVYVDSTGKNYNGTLAEIAKVATVQGGVSYFNAKVTFDADEYAHSGISAEVRLTNIDERSVPAILASAVSYREDNTAYVLLKGETGEPIETSITIGATDGTYIHVLSGISVGDVVLYTPTVFNPMEEMMRWGN